MDGRYPQDFQQPRVCILINYHNSILVQKRILATGSALSGEDSVPVIDMHTSGLSVAPSNLHCDICIIGTGPAGNVVARELSGTDIAVVVLESGGFARHDDADALNAIENVGRPRVVDQWEVRNRIVGGSSHTWGGRCAPFDEIDFEARDWVPLSGWPLNLVNIAPHLRRSASHLGLTGDESSDDALQPLVQRSPAMQRLDRAKIRPFFWQFSRDAGKAHDYMRFGRRFTSQIGSNVTLITGATALRIDPSACGRAVQSVIFAMPDGSRRTLWTRTAVLCAGGIENARLLLASDTVLPHGLGNERDLVGRTLMDHPRGPIGAFDLSTSEDLQRRFGRFNVRGALFRAGFRVSPDVQRSEKLLNCSAWLGEKWASDDPWEAAKRVIRGAPQLPADAMAILGNAGLFIRGVRDYATGRGGVARKLDVLTLDAMCEQRPDSDSRVTLSNLRDRFGMRLPRIDWRIHSDEARTMRRTACLVAGEFERLGLPPLAIAEWVHDEGDLPASFVDVAHPTGTTRMAANAENGVVDANCRVHSVDGLYLAGSSVFPTSGHCNPTQMIVALAIRLADHLKDIVRAERAPAVRSSDAVRGPGMLHGNFVALEKSE